MRTFRNLKLVVFDFDGTIADTMNIGLQIANDLSAKYRYRKVSSEELINYRNLNTREALERVGISYFKLPFIILDFRRELKKRIRLLEPVKGMVSVINQLHLRKCSVGIVTSNSIENVESFLNNASISSKFQFVQAQKSLFRKNTSLKSILKNYKLRPLEVLYVGDETRDIEAARQCGIPIASVCWGFNTKMVLRRHDPDYLIESPSELLELIIQELSYEFSNSLRLKGA